MRRNTIDDTLTVDIAPPACDHRGVTRNHYSQKAFSCRIEGGLSTEADKLLDEVMHLPAPPTSAGVLKNGIRYSHAAMMDALIAQPWLRQNDLARMFGRSASWISTIMASDAWQAAFAARKEAIVDPELKLSIEEHTRGLYLRSLEVLQEKLNPDASNIPDQLALQVFAHSSRALGYGAAPQQRTTVSETHIHLEQLGENLVSLLRRRKTEVIENGEESQPLQRQNAPGNGRLLTAEGGKEVPCGGGGSAAPTNGGGGGDSAASEIRPERMK